jgi:hypothetical protein
MSREWDDWYRDIEPGQPSGGSPSSQRQGAGPSYTLNEVLRLCKRCRADGLRPALARPILARAAMA